MKTREKNRRVKLEDFIFKTAIFGHILKQALQADLVKKLDRGSWTMAKGHIPWSDFMVHGVNRLLMRMSNCVTYLVLRCMKVTLMIDIFTIMVTS